MPRLAPSSPLTIQSASIPIELKARLVKAAKRLGVSQSQIICTALNLYIPPNEKKVSV